MKYAEASVIGMHLHWHCQSQRFVLCEVIHGNADRLSSVVFGSSASALHNVLSGALRHPSPDPPLAAAGSCCRALGAAAYIRARKIRQHRQLTPQAGSAARFHKEQ